MPSSVYLTSIRPYISGARGFMARRARKNWYVTCYGYFSSVAPTLGDSNRRRAAHRARLCMKTKSSAVVTIDRCRRALYASALSDYLATAGRASTPIAIVDDDAAVGDVLRRARAANASQVAVTTRSGETHATIEHRCVSMRDIARAWIDNATHEVEDRWFFEEYRVRVVVSSRARLILTRRRRRCEISRRRCR